MVRSIREMDDLWNGRLRAADMRQTRADRLSWQGTSGQIGRPTANPDIARAGALSGPILDLVTEFARPG
jgi:hypothetical protein